MSDCGLNITSASSYASLLFSYALCINDSVDRFGHFSYTPYLHAYVSIGRRIAPIIRSHDADTFTIDSLSTSTVTVL